MIQLTQIVPSLHSAQLVAWAQAPELREYFRRFPPTMKWVHDVPNTFAGTSAIYRDEEFVGLAGLFNIDLQSRKAEIGILIDSSKVTKRAPVCVAAMKQVAEYAFDYLGLNKLYCHVLPHRDDLQRLLGLYGFRREGELRDNLFWEGKFHDELLLSLTVQEFRKGKH